MVHRLRYSVRTGHTWFPILSHIGWIINGDRPVPTTEPNIAIWYHGMRTESTQKILRIPGFQTQISDEQISWLEQIKSYALDHLKDTCNRSLRVELNKILPGSAETPDQLQYAINQPTHLTLYDDDYYDDNGKHTMPNLSPNSIHTRSRSSING